MLADLPARLAHSYARNGAATRHPPRSLRLALAWLATTAACEVETAPPAPTGGVAAAAELTAAAGADPVLERWELLGENPKHLPVKDIFSQYQQARMEDLANPMLTNLVDYVERPVIEQRPSEQTAATSSPGSSEGAEAEAVDLTDVRTSQPLAQYRLAILMTGVAQPKAVFEGPNGTRIVVARGDPIGSEGGRVKAILQYQVLVAVPGKVDAIALSIEPPLASLVSDGESSATPKKDL